LEGGLVGTSWYLVDALISELGFSVNKCENEISDVSSEFVLYKIKCEMA
jgi:hypothetical protein